MFDCLYWVHLSIIYPCKALAFIIHSILDDQSLIKIIFALIPFVISLSPYPNPKPQIDLSPSGSLVNGTILKYDLHL